MKVYNIAAVLAEASVIVLCNPFLQLSSVYWLLALDL